MGQCSADRWVCTAGHHVRATAHCCMIGCIRKMAEPNTVTPTAIVPSTNELSSSCTAALVDLPPGSPISRDLALRLIRCNHADLPALLAAARAAKENFKPGVITYSRKVFLPLTNLCRDYCGYCIFRRHPREPPAHTTTPTQLLALSPTVTQLLPTNALSTLPA